MNLKPFNLELAKQGHPVVTRDGKPVRILCFDRTTVSDNQPIVALVKWENGSESLDSFSIDGSFYIGGAVKASRDLFMAPRKATKWVNFYQLSDGRVLSGEATYETQELAERSGTPTRDIKYLGAFQSEIEL